MPTSKQRRETARRRLERQIQRRQEAAAKRRKRTVYVAAALSVLVVLGAVWLIVINTNDDNPAQAANSPSASPSSPSPSETSKPPAHEPRSTNGPCKYAETAETLSNPNIKDVGLPPDPKPTPATGTVPVTVKTSQGDLTITLDRAKAPCAVQSMLFLIGKKFFDNTPCPRVSEAAKDGLGVLQCGDPSGTTGGGPSYQFKEENLDKASYDLGVVAMAKSSAPGSTGSQFFIMHEPAPGLGKDYSVIGKVTKGLDVVQKVAKGGNDGSNQAGGGKPNLPITIISMTAPK